MAIAGAMKVAGKALGKAIKVIKKKKKQLEKTKAGKKVKETVKKVKENPKVKKATKAVGTAARYAGGVTAGAVGAGLGATTGMGAVAGGIAGGTVGKAVRATKKAADKLRGKKVKIDPKDKRQPNPFGGKPMLSENEVMDSLKGGVAGGVLGLGAGVAGLGLMTASLFKSNTSPEQLYETSRLPDGRFSTKFSDANKNVVFSRKQLTPKEVDDVRTKLAILDSILESTDPSKRKNEFLNTAMYLGKTYGISNVSGKQLSLLMPTEVYEGKSVRYTKRTG